MSACLAMSGTFAAIFSFEASKKWIIREGPNGISRTGSGASIASGWKKSRGFLMTADFSYQRASSRSSIASSATGSKWVPRSARIISTASSWLKALR